MRVKAVQENIYKFRSLRIGVALLAAAFGMFFPIFSGPFVPDGLVNVVWGSLYGLGFALLHILFHGYHLGFLGFTYAVLGFLIWPIVLTLLLIKLFKSLDAAKSPYLKVAVLIVVACSFAVNIPITKVQGSYADGLPIFTKYIDF